MSSTKRTKFTSYIDEEDTQQLVAIEKHAGIHRAEQVRRGVKLWIRSRPKAERRAVAAAKRS